MSTASIPPEKIALFGVLAVGAYWFLTRRVNAGQQTNTAATLFARQNRTPSNPAASRQAIYEPTTALASSLGSVANKLFNMNWGNSSGATTTRDAAGNAYPSPGDFSRMDRLGSSTTDGIAANPSNNTPVIDALDPNGYGEG